jgi:hypothetical protein
LIYDDGFSCVVRTLQLEDLLALYIYIYIV